MIFAVCHIVAALTPAFSVLFATRVVAAVANAGFLAVALSTATRLVTPDQKGRALAVLLSGTTIATVAGVPAGALVGTALVGGPLSGQWHCCVYRQQWGSPSAFMATS